MYRTSKKFIVTSLFLPTSFCKILFLKVLFNGERGRTFEVQKLKDLRNRVNFLITNKYIYISLT